METKQILGFRILPALLLAHCWLIVVHDSIRLYALSIKLILISYCYFLIYSEDLCYIV